MVDQTTIESHNPTTLTLRETFRGAYSMSHPLQTLARDSDWPTGDQILEGGT